VCKECKKSDIGIDCIQGFLLAASKKYGIIRKTVAGRRIIPAGFWGRWCRGSFSCPRPLVNHTGDF